MVQDNGDKRVNMDESRVRDKDEGRVTSASGDKRSKGNGVRGDVI